MPAHTETATVEGETAEIGRDPRKMTVAELEAVGHPRKPILRAIREKCIDCCAGYVAEVRRCRMIDCSLWPFRMSANPYRVLNLTDEQRAELSARLQGRGKPNPDMDDPELE
jgi:hypothetical protein